jgi:hypothetical protein
MPFLLPLRAALACLSPRETARRAGTTAEVGSKMRIPANSAVIRAMKLLDDLLQLHRTMDEGIWGVVVAAVEAAVNCLVDSMQAPACPRHATCAAATMVAQMMSVLGRSEGQTRLRLASSSIHLFCCLVHCLARPETDALHRAAITKASVDAV